jgi:DNA-binding NtrC family response regulator
MIRRRGLSLESGARRFHEDPYYRVKLMELAVPPLRRRKEDILPLTRILLAEPPLRMKRSGDGLSAGAADRLLVSGWPGNVRELSNSVESNGGNRRGAAPELGIGLSTPHRKMKSYHARAGG